MSATSSSFGSVRDARFKKIFYDRYAQIPSMLKTFYDFDDLGPEKTQTRYGGVGAFSNFTEYNGSANYDDLYPDYEHILTHRAFTKFFSVERTLFDDDLHHIFDQKPKGMATAAARSREEHGARPFNLAFGVDAYFVNASEGVALCSNSHTTNSGASTATGFDNLTTAPFSATSLEAIRIQMIDLRDDRGNRIALSPDTIIHPPALYGRVHEVVKSEGKPESALNDSNVHHNQYEGIEWQYLTDVNNYFVVNKTAMKDHMKWLDRIPLEFGWVEDFEGFLAKYRAYMRYSCGPIGWRWLVGALVS